MKSKKFFEKVKEDLDIFYKDITPDYDYDDYEDNIPVGCAACGGDYPYCKQGCPLFDDE